jgi:hypothetical protein
MTLLGLFLAASLSIGLAAQSCNVGGTDFTIDDLSDHVVVTNASATEDATVNVSTALGSVDLDIPAGTSGTAWFVAARTYTLKVVASDDPSGLTYRQGLLDLRDKLETLSLHPENPSADVAGALVELSVVQSALQQMHGSRASQTCSATLTTGVDGKATVTWSTSGLSGTGIWMLGCE